MKKTVSKLLALAMASAMVLTGCGGASTPAEDEKPAEGDKTEKPAEGDKEEAAADKDKYQIKDLVITKGATREIETFNLLYSQRAESVRAPYHPSTQPIRRVRS